MAKEEVKKEEQESTEPAADEAKAGGSDAVEAAPLKGLVGTKIGMARVFVDDTRMVPVTVISAEGLVVSQVKSVESDGYNAVQVAYGDVVERKLSKAEANHLAKKGVSLKRHLYEFRVDDVALFKVGQPVSVANFQKGEWVQVSGVTKGKGFAGSIKRHGFGGGPHSHGHGEYRRSPGSSGGQGPQRVLPGTRKPGHLGSVLQTVPTIEVVDVDAEKNLILVRGSVPGPNGNFVVVKPSKRRVAKVEKAKK